MTSPYIHPPLHQWSAHLPPTLSNSPNNVSPQPHPRRNSFLRAPTRRSSPSATLANTITSQACHVKSRWDPCRLSDGPSRCGHFLTRDWGCHVYCVGGCRVTGDKSGGVCVFGLSFFDGGVSDLHLFFFFFLFIMGTLFSGCVWSMKNLVEGWEQWPKTVSMAVLMMMMMKDRLMFQWSTDGASGR